MYAPGSPERASIEGRLAEMAAAEPVELTAVIDGEHRHAGGDAFDVTMPSDHAHVLGRAHHSTAADAEAAIAAATRAAPGWAAMDFDDRAAIFLRAADLLAGPWRDTLNGATMLGQAKTVQQAEIDAACELIDFLRFNVAFARQILADQPISSPGVWNRTDYRPAGRFRLRDHAVQLHRDRRQPGHGARADGQHGDLEAEPHPAAGGALHVRDPGGGRTAAGGDQPAAR